MLLSLPSPPKFWSDLTSTSRPSLSRPSQLLGLEGEGMEGGEPGRASNHKLDERHLFLLRFSPNKLFKRSNNVRHKSAALKTF